VNSCCSGGMLSVDRVAVRRSEVIVARSFSLDTRDRQMRTVEFNQAMSGREGALNRRALPPAPPNPGLALCHCHVLLDIKKGTFLIR
jgi:hypothetical protein